MGSRRFARRYSGVRVRFPFLGVLRCFSSPGARAPPYAFGRGRAGITGTGCPIRESSDRRVPAAPRGVSPRGRALHRPGRPRHPPRAHPRSRPSCPVSFVSSSGTWAPCPPDTAKTRSPPRRVLARETSPPHARSRGAMSLLQSCLAFPCQGARVEERTDAATHRLPPGGAEGARTPSLRRARAALSQLSYGPSVPSVRCPRKWARLDSNQGPRPYQGRALTN